MKNQRLHNAAAAAAAMVSDPLNLLNWERRGGIPTMNWNPQ